MTSVGAIFLPNHPPEHLRAAVETAEEAGIDQLWLWEDCFRESAFATAGAALAWTTRLRIGIGIAPMPMRNVAATAMEIATLARLFPGRLLPGIGHGVLPWMAQIGARVASPLTLMREYTPALRALLAGDEVSVAGRYVSLDSVALDWPPEVVPPVYAAGEGPKTLRLSGEVADGTVLTGGTTPQRAGEAVALATAGRRDAGREGDHVFTVYLPVPLHEEADAVAARVREFVAVGVAEVMLQPDPRADTVAFLRDTARVAALAS